MVQSQLDDMDEKGRMRYEMNLTDYKDFMFVRDRDEIKGTTPMKLQTERLQALRASSLGFHTTQIPGARLNIV